MKLIRPMIAHQKKKEKRQPTRSCVIYETYLVRLVLVITLLSETAGRHGNQFQAGLPLGRRWAGQPPGDVPAPCPCPVQVALAPPDPAAVGPLEHGPGEYKLPP